MNSTQASVEAIRKSLVVNCSRGRAFEVFTREIGTWWPTDPDHSIRGDKIVDNRAGGALRRRGQRTRVELEHRGWEIYAAEVDDAQQSYNSGWDVVLGHYERKLNG
jgi:hypothetical protein